MTLSGSQRMMRHTGNEKGPDSLGRLQYGILDNGLTLDLVMSREGKYQTKKLLGL